MGFDPSTLITRRVRALAPGGAADRAGLREGDVPDLPRYGDIVRLNPGDVLNIGVTRDGNTTQLIIPLTGKTAPVPQWSSRLNSADHSSWGPDWRGGPADGRALR